jgi:hypothetical protein
VAVAALDTLAFHTAGDLLNGLGFTPAGKDALGALGRAGWSRTRSVVAAEGILDAALSRGRLSVAREIGAEASRQSPEWVGYLLNLAGADPGPTGVAPRDCEGRALCLLIVGVEAVDAPDPETLSSVRAELENRLADAREGGDDRRAGALEQSGEALAGYQAWRRGDRRGAFSTLSETQSDPATPWQVATLARLWMGQVAGEEGRIVDAAALFTSLEQSSPLGWYGVLLEARLHADAGNDTDSQREYRRFLDLWSEAPPDHPYVLEARAALPA